jgi:hypothetical protein
MCHVRQILQHAVKPINQPCRAVYAVVCGCPMHGLWLMCTSDIALYVSQLPVYGNSRLHSHSTLHSWQAVCRCIACCAACIPALAMRCAAHLGVVHSSTIAQIVWSFIRPAAYEASGADVSSTQLICDNVLQGVRRADQGVRRSPFGHGPCV